MYRWILFGCSVCVSILASGIFVRSSYEKSFLDGLNQEKEQTTAYIQSVFQGEGAPSGLFVESESVRSDGFARLWGMIQSPDYIRMKAWSTDRVLLWSDVREEIGRRFLENHELEEAISGEVEYELVSNEKTENITERQYSELSEIYIPIFDSRKTVVGVVELYKPTTELRSIAREAAWKSAVLSILFSGTVISFLGIFLFRRKMGISGV